MLEEVYFGAEFLVLLLEDGVGFDVLVELYFYA